MAAGTTRGALTSSRNASERGSRSSEYRRNSRIDASTSRSTASGSRDPGASRRRARTSLAKDAAQRRHPAIALTGLQHPVALHAAVDLRPDAELVGQTHLVPACDAAGGHLGIEQLVGSMQQRVQRFGRVPLLERAIGQLGHVPGRGRRLERVSQSKPGVPDHHLGDDIEGPPASELDAQLGKRLQAAADSAGGPSNAFRNCLQLADFRGDQREDAIGLAEVEAGQDDRVGDIHARGRHARHPSTGEGPRIARRNLDIPAG